MSVPQGTPMGSPSPGLGYPPPGAPGTNPYPQAPTTQFAYPRPRSRFRSEVNLPEWVNVEFVVYIVSVLAVLIASQLVGTSTHTGPNGAVTGDYFRADLAWILITALTISYMLSRAISTIGHRGVSHGNPGWHHENDAR